MSAAKTHYRLCKDFMTVAFNFYQLDNYVGGIDTTREVDPDDIDEIFSLTPPVLEAASNFTVSLGELMESDEIETPVKNMAAFLATVVQHWADTARMAESAFRNLLIRQERSNIDDNLAVLDQLVDSFEDEDEVEDDEEGLDEVYGEGAEDDVEDDGSEDIEADVDETEEDADEAPVDDEDAEEVSEDVGDDAIDSEGDSDETDGESEDTEEYEPEIFVNDSAESYGVIERDEPEPEPETEPQVDAEGVPDDEAETPAPDMTEKRYSLEDVKRIITNEDPIPVEIIPDVARFYSQKMAVDDMVKSASEAPAPERIAVNEDDSDWAAVPTLGDVPVDHPKRIDLGSEPEPETEEPAPVEEPVEEKPKRGLRGLGRSTKSTKSDKTKSTRSGGTRRSSKKKTEGGEQ